MTSPRKPHFPPGAEVWLYLDDERPAPPGWHLVKTPHECISILNRAAEDGYEVAQLSLDHDLGSGYATGYDVACWLETAVANGMASPGNMMSHSANPVGRKRILQCIASIERMVKA